LIYVPGIQYKQNTGKKNKQHPLAAQTAPKTENPTEKH